MQCEKCKKERKKGKSYEFFYGHGESVRTGGDALSKKYRVTAVISGSDQAWICNTCVTKRVLLTFGLGSLLTLGLIIALEEVSWLPFPYSDYSYRMLSFLGRIFGPQLGIQINRVISSVMSTILSPTFRTIWGLSGIAGIYLLWQGFSEIGVVGDNLAIKASRSRLKVYNLIINRKQYKKAFKKDPPS